MCCTGETHTANCRESTRRKKSWSKTSSLEVSATPFPIKTSCWLTSVWTVWFPSQNASLQTLKKRPKEPKNEKFIFDFKKYFLWTLLRETRTIVQEQTFRCIFSKLHLNKLKWRNRRGGTINNFCIHVMQQSKDRKFNAPLKRWNTAGGAAYKKRRNTEGGEIRKTEHQREVNTDKIQQTRVGGGEESSWKKTSGNRGCSICSSRGLER